jgi:hypothetical protein
MVRPSPFLPTVLARQGSYPELYATSTAAAAPSAATVTQRATVACDHCRRSKIRCKHKDCAPPCEHCRDRGLKCVFSPSAVQNKGQRRESDPRAVDVSAVFNILFGAITIPSTGSMNQNSLATNFSTGVAHPRPATHSLEHDVPFSHIGT